MANQSIEEFESLADIPLYAGAAGLGLVGGAVYARLPDNTYLLLTPGVDAGIIELTGDGTAGPGSGIQAFTLAASGATPGTYNTPYDIVVDAKGRITAISASPVQWPISVPAGRLLYSTAGDAIGSSDALFADGARMGVRDAGGEASFGATYDSCFLASDDPLTAFLFALQRSRGTRATPTIVQDGDVLGQFFFYGHDGSTGRPAAAIQAVVEGTPGADDMPCALEFYTRPQGGGALVKRFTVHANGTVEFEQAISAPGLVIGALTYPAVDAAAGAVMKTNGSGALALEAITQTFSLALPVDGGGSVITTGVKGFVRIPFACTITAWTILSTDAAALTGSIVFDLWMDVFANYPPTVADTITASAKPTLTTAKAAEGSTLTGWTTAIPAGSVLAYNVDSVTTLTKALLQLTLTRTL